VRVRGVRFDIADGNAYEYRNTFPGCDSDSRTDGDADANAGSDARLHTVSGRRAHHHRVVGNQRDVHEVMW
jgi:hypothetical protein